MGDVINYLQSNSCPSLPTPENNTQRLGGQLHISNEDTQRDPQRHASPTSKYQLFERHERQYHDLQKCMSLLSNFTPRTSRLGLALMKTTHKTKSPWGGFTVLDQLTTKDLVLLGFSIMPQ